MHNKYLLSFYLELMAAFLCALLVFFLFVGLADVLSRAYPGSWLVGAAEVAACLGSLATAAGGVYVVLTRNVRE